MQGSCKPPKQACGNSRRNATIWDVGWRGRPTCLSWGLGACLRVCVRGCPSARLDSAEWKSSSDRVYINNCACFSQTVEGCCFDDWSFRTFSFSRMYSFPADHVVCIFVSSQLCVRRHFPILCSTNCGAPQHCNKACLLRTFLTSPMPYRPPAAMFPTRFLVKCVEVACAFHCVRFNGWSTPRPTLHDGSWPVGAAGPSFGRALST